MTTNEPAEAGALSALDQWFDRTSLSALRASTHACAAQVGMPADRATDIVIVLHELAANAVRHGAGSGRLRIWEQFGALHCRVDDDGPAAASPGGRAGGGTNTAAANGLNLARMLHGAAARRGRASAAGRLGRPPWRGHGHQ
jgi:anti-sigma regulatory factor (Ser/Thr protein kinase)